jgi:hypothetical protein
MRKLILSLATAATLLFGSLAVTNTAEARPYRYYGAPYYGGGYYRPYYQPYYRPYAYRPYGNRNFYYGPSYYDYGYPGYRYYGYPGYRTGARVDLGPVGIYLR